MKVEQTKPVEEEKLEDYIARARVEAETLTNEQLKNRTKALETETSSMKSDMNRMKKEMSKYFS
jgi:hypothetical protein